MTEAPGRKTDAHLSSVPGGEGRAAKIGEVLEQTRQGVGRIRALYELTTANTLKDVKHDVF